MSTITDKATLILKPVARKAGYLYGYNPKDPSNPVIPFTVARNSAASEIDSEGFIRFVPANMPTFTWENKEVSISTNSQSINKILYPFDYGNSYWYKYGATIDDNGGVYYPSPIKDSSGNIINCARKLVATVANPTIQLGTGIDMTTVTNSAKFYIIKPINEKQYTLNGIAINFDTETYGTGIKVEGLADGFYKLILEESSSSSDKVALIGTSVSGGDVCYLAGVQLEAQVAATSLINNPLNAEGAEVTRLGDKISCNISQFTSLRKFTLFYSIYLPYNSSGSSINIGIGLDTASSPDSLGIYKRAGSNIKIFVTDATTTTYFEVPDSNFKEFKIAIVNDEDTQKVFMNGEYKTTGNLGTDATNLIYSVLKNGGNIKYPYNIKDHQLLELLTDEEAIELTK